jgi:hypothetical protein
MATIMKRTFPDPGKGRAEENLKELVTPTEYVDSIVASSYINAINCKVMRTIRKLNFEDAVYGTSDVNPLLVNAEADLDSREPGFWIVNTSKDTKYSLTLYQRIKHAGYISLFDSYENKKLCEFYYIKCKRSVPRITVKPTRFEKFETELKAAVSGFKVNAERNE